MSNICFSYWLISTEAFWGSVCLNQRPRSLLRCDTCQTHDCVVCQQRLRGSSSRWPVCTPYLTVTPSDRLRAHFASSSSSSSVQQTSPPALGPTGLSSWLCLFSKPERPRFWTQVYITSDGVSSSTGFRTPVTSQELKWGTRIRIVLQLLKYNVHKPIKGVLWYLKKNK